MRSVIVSADLVTFTKEILNGKLHLFVQWIIYIPFPFIMLRQLLQNVGK